MLFLMAQHVAYIHLKYSIIILFLVHSMVAHASDSLFTRISVAHTFFTTDVYNNIYCITPDNEIVRYGLNGTRVTFSNLKYGKPSTVDAGNPLKTMVYYADLQTLVILDKMLADIAVLRFSNINGTSYRPSVVCRASGGDHIWLFDELSQRVVRLDETGNLIAMSEPWYQLNIDAGTPVWMQSAQDQVYIYTSSGILHIFDAFGTWSKSFEIHSQPLDIVQQQLLLNDEAGLHLFDLQTTQEVFLPITCAGTTVHMQPNYLYCGNGTEISVYRIR